LSIIVDSNIIIDAMTRTNTWHRWSSDQLKKLSRTNQLVINTIVYSEISAAFNTIEDLDASLNAQAFIKELIPWEAAFLAGKCYSIYLKRGGSKTSLLPDFYIGAHAYVTQRALLTRDSRRYSGYFPKLKIIAPY
jgi:predicted nucleic acid-binding protein